MVFHFDLVERSSVRNTVNGVEIVRGVRVNDVDIAAGTSDPSALLRIIADPSCPPLHAQHPDPDWEEATLEEHVLVAVDRQKRKVDLDLVYRAGPQDLNLPGNPVTFLVEQSSQQAAVTTYTTAGGGAAITVWYKAGEADTTTSAPTDALIDGLGVTKILTFDVLRAVGTASRAQWDAIKGTIRGARGKIHSDSWGAASRGTYLFLGPSIRYYNNAKTVSIQLDFLGSIDGHFPVGAYFDERGQHPGDSANEGLLDVPAEGALSGRNGMVKASVYPETGFSGLFNFTPDD